MSGDGNLLESEVMTASETDPLEKLENSDFELILKDNCNIVQVSSVESLNIACKKQKGDLKDFLESCGEGKLILQAYQENNESLNRQLRSRLVRLIISRERDRVLKTVGSDEKLQKFIISSQYFKSLARQVVNLFKGEIENSYYTPTTTVDRKSTPPSGKLWEHFNYEKKKLRDAGLLQSSAPSTAQKSMRDLTTVEKDNKTNLTYFLKKPMVKMNKWRAAKKRNLVLLCNSFNPRYKKRERTQNWSAADKSWLFEIVKNYKHIIDKKSTSNRKKNETWQLIQKDFMTKCETERNSTRIKEQWCRMKAVAKMEISSYNAKINEVGLQEAEKYKPSELSIKIWQQCSNPKLATNDCDSSDESENVIEISELSNQNLPETEDKPKDKISSTQRFSPTNEIEISETEIKIENDIDIAEMPSFNTIEDDIEENSLKRPDDSNDSDDSLYHKKRKLSLNNNLNETSEATAKALDTSTTTLPNPQHQRIYVRENLLKPIKPLQNKMLRIIPPPVENKNKAPTLPVVNATTATATTVPLHLLLSKNLQPKVIAARAVPVDYKQIEQQKKIELLDLQLDVAKVHKETALNELKISLLKKQMMEKEAIDSQARMTGERGSGAGKGGGGGGSIREAGGSFGKMEAAREDQYFYNLQKEQITKLQEDLHDEISFHEEQIKRHQEAISRHKKRINDMDTN